MEKRSRFTPYFLAILTALVLTGSGCGDEFYDQNAGDRITPDKHYQSIVDASVSLQGAIIPYQDVLPRLYILDGLRSDMMDVTTNADAYLREINEQVFNASNPYTNPADLYKVIININEVLANIDNVGLKDRNFDDFFSHYFKGALIGMRSYTYLTLVRMYGKAAYIEDNLVALPSNLNQLVITKDVMLDTLINQVTPYIHDNTAGTQYAELRIGHFVNTKALLGELYLEKNMYAEAATYLKLACESYFNLSALLKVDKSYQYIGWQNIHLNAEGGFLENLAVIPFSSNEGQYNPLVKWINYSNDFMVKPTKVLVDSFMAQIPAAAGPVGDIWRGPGITFDVDTLAQLTDTTYLTETYITKYEIDKSDPFSSDIIISRAADIHLLLAEALNRLGDPTSQKYALMLLNQGVNKENPKPAIYSKWANNMGIRGRVALASRVVPAEVTGEDATRMIEDFIIAERALELAYEGKRWNDLVRIAERRGEPEYLADKVAAKFAGTPMYDQIHAKLMNPANWYLPFE